ncbi:hypothetical protein KM043_012031 [Ampulex compressa]|nr:hypothetical protein KM043_012031 [Ampulex compressa]
MCERRILGLAIVALVTLGGRVAAFTNQWAAHIPGGPEVAEQVAQECGFRYLDKVSALSPFDARDLGRESDREPCAGDRLSLLDYRSFGSLAISGDRTSSVSFFLFLG